MALSDQPHSLITNCLSSTFPPVQPHAVSFSAFFLKKCKSFDSTKALFSYFRVVMKGPQTSCETIQSTKSLNSLHGTQIASSENTGKTGKKELSFTLNLFFFSTFQDNNSDVHLVVVLCEYLTCLWKYFCFYFVYLLLWAPFDIRRFLLPMAIFFFHLLFLPSMGAAFVFHNLLKFFRPFHFFPQDSLVQYES